MLLVVSDGGIPAFAATAGARYVRVCRSHPCVVWRLSPVRTCDGAALELAPRWSCCECTSCGAQLTPAARSWHGTRRLLLGRCPWRSSSAIAPLGTDPSSSAARKHRRRVGVRPGLRLLSRSRTTRGGRAASPPALDLAPVLVLELEAVQGCHDRCGVAPWLAAASRCPRHRSRLGAR